MLLLAALGIHVLGGRFEPLDRAALTLAQDLRSPWLDAIMRGVTVLGSLAFLLPASGLAAAGLWRLGRRDEACFVVLALTGTSIMSQWLKTLMRRPRPDLFAPLVAPPGDFSFPSAHAAQITAVVMAAGLLLWPASSSPVRAVLVTAGLVTVGAVALSRIHLQVHYPTDVIAGVLCGLAWVVGLTTFRPFATRWP